MTDDHQLLEREEVEITLAGQVADEMKEYGIEVLGIHVLK